MFSSPAARRLEHLRKSQNTGKASPPVCTRRCSLAKALSKVEARKARLLPTDTPRCDQSHVSSLPIDQPSPLLLAQPASSAGAGLLDISDSMSATESLLSSASCFLATSPLPARSLLIDAEDLRANDAQLDAISSFGASLAETLLQDCRLPSSGQIYGADSAEKDNSGSTSISSSMAEDDELMLAVGIDSLQSPARSNQSVGAVLGRELPGECSVPSPVEANGSLASRLRSLPTPGRSYCKQLSSTTSDPKRSRSTEDAATGTDATRSRDPSAPDVERAAVTRTRDADMQLQFELHRCRSFLQPQTREGGAPLTRSSEVTFHARKCRWPRPTRPAAFVRFRGRADEACVQWQRRRRVRHLF